MIAVKVGMGRADWSMLLASNEANIGRSSVNLLSSIWSLSASISSLLDVHRCDGVSSLTHLGRDKRLPVVGIAVGEKASILTELIVTENTQKSSHLQGCVIMVIKADSEKSESITVCAILRLVQNGAAKIWCIFDSVDHLFDRRGACLTRWFWSHSRVAILRNPIYMCRTLPAF